jgi:predicted permease
MRWLARLRLRLRTLLVRGRVERELEDEMAFHLHMEAEANRRAGLDAAAARQEARRDFGTLLAPREGCREAWGAGAADALLRDLRLAWRSLRRGPALAAVGMLSLALGIGANIAVFSLIDAVLLRPVPLPSPERILTFTELRGGQESTSNPVRLRDWQAQATGLAAVGGTYGEDLVLTGAGEPVRLNVLRTAGDMVGVLGVAPALGRAFTPDERRGRGAPVALLADRLWRQRFGGRPAALGSVLVLGGVAHTVVGVLPAAAAYPYDVELWAPAPLEQQESTRTAGFLSLAARLAPGVTVPQAAAQLQAVAARLGRQYPDSDAGLAVRLAPFAASQIGAGRAPLLALGAAVGLVLLIACVNLATLLLSRATARRREAAIRVALGGGRASLVRLFLSESMLLALGGGAAGLLAAPAAIGLLRRLLPTDLPRLAAARVDWRVAGFALALTLLSGLAAGLAPAWRAAAGHLGGMLKDGAAAAGGVRRDGLSRLFVVGEVTLSLMLLVGASLLTQSALALTAVPVGVRAAGVLTLGAALPWDTPAGRLHAFQRDALERLEAIPGVLSAGLIDRLPLAGGTQSPYLAVRGRRLPPDVEQQEFSKRATSPRYFATLGIPLRAGRTLDPYRQDAPRTTVIDETLARRLFGGGDPLGQFLAFGPSRAALARPTVWYEIVGVVGDVRQSPAAPAAGEAYVLAEHTFWPLTHFVLRTQGDPLALAADARAVLRRLDSNLVLDGVEPLDRQLAAATAEPRLRMWAAAAFALLSLTLAAIGLFGVLAQDMLGRRREIAVRMALGAQPRQMLWLSLRRGLLLAAAGILLGSLGALAEGGLLASLLFGVRATDARAFAIAALTMLLVAAGACLLPAWRAARTDALEALKLE